MGRFQSTIGSRKREGASCDRGGLHLGGPRDQPESVQLWSLGEHDRRMRAMRSYPGFKESIGSRIRGWAGRIFTPISVAALFVVLPIGGYALRHWSGWPVPLADDGILVFLAASATLAVLALWKVPQWHV